MIKNKNKICKFKIYNLVFICMCISSEVKGNPILELMSVGSGADPGF